MPRPSCQRKGCYRTRPGFGFFLGRKPLPRFEGSEFCSEECLVMHVEAVLAERWRSLSHARHRQVPRPRLGTILLQAAAVTRDQLDRAVLQQKDAGEGLLGEWLQRLGFVTEPEITAALSMQYGLPIIKLRENDVPSDAVHVVPGRAARMFNVLPVGFDDTQDALRVAVCPPLDFQYQESFRRMTDRGLVTYIADRSTLDVLLERWYESEVDDEPAAEFDTFDDLVEIAGATIRFACENRAENLRFELPGGCFWTRIDFPTGSIHQFYERVPAVEHLRAADSSAVPLRAAVAC